MYIVFPYDAKNDSKALSERFLKKYFPKTLAYFQQFKNELLDRAHYRQHFAASGQPYWSMYNVGNYTFAPYQVVWKEQSSSFKCAVLDSDEEALPVANHKLTIVPFYQAHEAYYVAALLNSSPARLFIDSYVISVQISTHIFKYLNIPRFTEQVRVHQDLANYGRQCHVFMRNERHNEVTTTMGHIDECAAKLWGLTGPELEAIRKLVVDVPDDHDDECED